MQRLLAICCLLLVATLSCTRDLHGAQHLVAPDHAAQFNIAPYPGQWEFRYGESPLNADGSFQFIEPAHSDGGWQPIKSPYLPPGRGTARYLWLRTRLTGPPLAEPTLYFQSVSQSFQAFIDGQLIAEFGAMQGAHALRFPGEPRIYLPLQRASATEQSLPSPMNYVGRTLVLRIFSPHRYIGVFGDVLIGAHSSLITHQVQRSASAFVVGVLMIGIGLLGLLLFTLRFSDRVYLYYDCFAIAAGTHILARSALREILFYDPALWGLLEFFSLPLLAIFLCTFVWKTVGRGPWGIMPRLTMLFLLFLLLSAGLVVSGKQNLWDILLPLQILLMVGIVGLVTTLLLAAQRGDTGARILTVGFVFCVGSAVSDILVSMNLISGNHYIINHFGSVGLVVSLGAVLGRRIVVMALVTDRAKRLETESALQAQRLAEQSRLLTAAGRMAKGDLVSQITVPNGSELSPLATALDSMRQDLQQKLQQLEQSNVEIRGLNDELRRQIEQRSQRLMEAVAQGFGNGTGPGQPAMVVPGQRLGEHYQVLATIGRGAMGAVFEVERVRDHRRFAAKILTEARKKTALLRFAREAQILCRLDHPNLISIVDIDVTQDGIVFLVMELVRGSVLRLREDRYRELHFATNVLRQITAGLEAIHRSGIVHRDLKPANVLITEEASGMVRVKLADFGISILSELAESSQPEPEGASAPVEPTDSTDSLSATLGRNQTPNGAHAQLTATGVLVGTPMYMAPELADGSRHARPSSDLFSLGIIAYEMLTGEMPFSSPLVWAKTPSEVRLAVPFRDRQLALPASLIAMLDRCLHPDPLIRPTAAELHEALASVQIG